ncbi:hypothetical protein HKL94_00780 [Candidatus Parcubacteria bacterium]|nr:hypothetical protein [Candidatus Parcubacteria bacterium]
MKKILILFVAIATTSVMSVAYAGGNDHHQPSSQAQGQSQGQAQGQSQGQAQGQAQGQGQSQQAFSGAAAGAASASNARSNVGVGVSTNLRTGPMNATGGMSSLTNSGNGGGATVGGVSANLRTGPTSATGGTAAGGSATGGKSSSSLTGSGNGTGTGTATATSAGGKSSSSLTGSGNGTGGGATLGNTGNGNGATVTTENHLLYINLPTAPPVAPTMVGYGGIAGVTSGCGPLREVIQKPISYLVVGIFGTKTVTLAGQTTDVLVPVLNRYGKPKNFDRVNNGDGTVTVWGSVYTEAAVVVSSSVSKQLNIGGFGMSGGGSAGGGSSSTITGTQRIIAVGRCVYRKYKIPTRQSLEK